MLSMTGFGLCKEKTNDGEIIVQVKSVNSRYLDIKIHVPREYSLWEKEIRDQLKKSMYRGTVEVYSSRKSQGATGKFNISSDKKLAMSWLKEYKKLSKELNLSTKNNDLRLIEVLKSAPVLTVQEDKDASSNEKKTFLKTFDTALKSCLNERKREGISLKKNFKLLLEDLANELKLVEKNRAKANIEIQKKWKTKIERFKGEKGLDPARLSQEAALLIEKSDINEEVIRLKEHISNCKSLLNTKGRVGKKLEFYTQELLREVNTIGSKSQIVELTNSVVNAKTIIEQIREQVQNIE